MAWCAVRAPRLGAAFLLEAVWVLDLIQRHPQAWHPLSAGIRRCRLRGFPHGVIHIAADDDALVLAIAHLHRRPGYWRERLEDLPR